MRLQSHCNLADWLAEFTSPRDPGFGIPEGVGSSDIADFEAKIAAATRDELLECMRARAPITMDDRRWGGRCRDEPQLGMHADEHAGACQCDVHDHDHDATRSLLPT